MVLSFEFSVLSFNYYGFFITLGILVGVLAAEKLKKKLLITNNQLLITDILPWVLIPSLIGARLYHVIDYWSYYSKDLIKILFVWQGGLGIFGGIIGGAVGLWIFAKIKYKRLTNFFLSLLDLGAIGLPLGQAIGRWGNYFNQELYGLPTSLAWGIFIKPENRLLGWENYSRFHPLFLYESLGCFIIFLILYVFLRCSATNCDPVFESRAKRLKNIPSTSGSDAINTKTLSNLLPHRKIGAVFFLYLFLYSFLRFWLEFLRIESWQIGSIRVNQLVALGLMLISFCLMMQTSGCNKRRK